MERDVDEREDDERHVEVDDVEEAVRRRALERPAEDLELVEVEDPVRPVREAVAEDVVAVVRERQEHLEEEERHDRQVVAREPARGKPDEEADNASDDRHDRDHEQRGQVDVVLIGAQESVGVRADAEEGDVAQVEQAAPADDDVQPEREQHEDDGVERDPADVAALEADRHEADDPDEEREPRPPRDDLEALLDRAEHSPAAGPSLAVPRHPFVATDGGARLSLGGARLGRAFERLREVVPVGRVRH